ARSLDLELAIAIPGSWTTPTNDWAAQLLVQRASDPGANLRERGTAAFGLWERAFTGAGNASDRPAKEAQARRQIATIIKDLESEAIGEQELREYDSAPPG